MKTIAVLCVVALQDQRCRAGRVFSREVTEIPAAELEEDQIKALKADPLLSVTEVERPAEAEADEQKAPDAEANATKGAPKK